MSESPWLRIGWRNLGRNPKRTVLTALGLAVGFFAVVFIVGWSQGIMVEMVESATSLVNGQIEIHDAEYRPERSLYDTIGGRDGTDVDAMLRTDRRRALGGGGGPACVRGGAHQLGSGDVGRDVHGHRPGARADTDPLSRPARRGPDTGAGPERDARRRGDGAPAVGAPRRRAGGRGVRGRRVDGQRPLHARRASFGRVSWSSMPASP